MTEPKASETPLSKTYMRLWRGWLSDHKGLLAITLVLMMITAISAAGYAKYIEWVVAALETASTSVIYWGPIGIVVLVIIKGISQYASQVIQAFALSKMQRRIQKEMYQKLVTMDLAHLMDEPPASLAARFSADVEVGKLACQVAFGALTAVFTIIAAFIVMISIDWVMTLGVIGIFAFAFIPVGVIGARVRKISAATQQEIADMTANLNEGLSGIRMVRTYQLEDRVLDQAKGVFGRLYKLRVTMVKWQAILSPMMEILGGIAIGMLVLLVALRIQSGAVELSGFMGLLTAIGVATNPARKLGAAYTVAQQGSAAFDRIFALFDVKNTIADPRNAKPLSKKLEGMIEFKNVDFTYPDGYKALHDIDLTLEAGKTYAFVGRSGAGKSTIFNLLPRLFDPSAGAITIDGRDIKDLPLSDLRAQISVVSQDSIMLSGTILENIQFGRADADFDAVREAAKSAAALEFIEELPEGFETEIASASANFSGGERQRLSIARAMLRDAPILLLDEPTSALDAESEAQIRNAIDTLSEDRTTLVIAHRLSTILHADQIIVLDQGRVVETGKHEELLSQKGLYADLFNLQFETNIAPVRRSMFRRQNPNEPGLLARFFGIGA